jgi:hypothetical protein
MDSSTQYLVLSYGRSGSVLLAQKLGRAHDVLPNYVKHHTELSSHQVQHSHVVFAKEQSNNFQRVFNLRANPIDTILSNVMVKHYNVHHRFNNQDVVSTPFTFTDWEYIDRWCNIYQQYHCQYAEQLDQHDIVVVYEHMINRLHNLNEVYLPIYPNKKNLITNYDQVVDCINQHEKSLLESQQAFVQHVNPVDIYSIIDQ